MPVNIIILVIFFLVMLIIAVLYRGATLDKLEMQEGESVLFEEQGVRVEQSGAPRSVIFGNCVVRVTGRRIIIAQKMLFRRKYALRHVIFFNDGSPDTDLAATFLKGYILMMVEKSSIQVEPGNGCGIVRIRIPETPLTMNQYIVYPTKRASDYVKIRNLRLVDY